MLRVVADTNIYISALNFGGMPERLLRLAAKGDIRLVVSDAILEEVGRVLRGEKFAWAEGKVAETLREIQLITERADPTHRLEVISADPSDNRILECADAGKVAYIVSDDKHLLNLKLHRQVPVIKVAEFLKQLQGQASEQR